MNCLLDNVHGCLSLSARPSNRQAQANWYYPTAPRVRPRNRTGRREIHGAETHHGGAEVAAQAGRRSLKGGLAAPREEPLARRRRAHDPRRARFPLPLGRGRNGGESRDRRLADLPRLCNPRSSRARDIPRGPIPRDMQGKRDRGLPARLRLRGPRPRRCRRGPEARHPNAPGPRPGSWFEDQRQGGPRPPVPRRQVDSARTDPLNSDPRFGFGTSRASSTRHAPAVPRQSGVPRTTSIDCSNGGASKTSVSNSPPSPHGWTPRVFRRRSSSWTTPSSHRRLSLLPSTASAETLEKAMSKPASR